MRNPTEVALQILDGFVRDPPDDDYQRGFLRAMLMFSNEVLGIPDDDQTWKAADALMTAPIAEPPKPRWTPRIVS